MFNILISFIKEFFLYTESKEKTMIVENFNKATILYKKCLNLLIELENYHEDPLYEEVKENFYEASKIYYIALKNYETLN